MPSGLNSSSMAASRLAGKVVPARIRIPSYAVWETVVFTMNVLAFIFIGLQIRPILASLAAGERGRYFAVAGAVLVTVIVVLPGATAVTVPLTDALSGTRVVVPSGCGPEAALIARHPASSGETSPALLSP